MPRPAGSEVADEFLPALVAPGLLETMDEEKPYGRGLTEANKERLLIDDMEEVSDWYCAQGRFTLPSRRWPVTKRTDWA